MAVIVDAVKTCAGARGGALSSWHAVELLAFSYESLASRIDLDPSLIDAAIATCRTTIGEQAFNVARSAVLASGWPESISAVTVEGSAGAGMSALQYATGLIASGSTHAVIVSGVETPSRVVAGSSIGIGTGKPFGPSVHERFAEDGGLLPPGVVAERIAMRHGFDRAVLDEWSVQSRTRAEAFEKAGGGKGFAIPVPLRIDRATELDPFLDADELLGKAVDVGHLKPLFESDGLVTAGNMAQPVDASAALLVVSEEFAERHGCTSLATVTRVATQGSPTLDGDDGVSVALRAVQEFPDLIAIHEDFASTPLAFAQQAKVSVNANGGALARGDAGGAAAAVLLAEVVHSVNAQQQAGLAVVAGVSDTAGAALLEPPR